MLWDLIQRIFRNFLPLFVVLHRLADRPVLSRRLHLVELHELAWWPSFSRQTIQDVLAELWNAPLPFLEPQRSAASTLVPVLAAALNRASSKHVVDVCSGSGGPLPGMAAGLVRMGGVESISLTDLFPNLAAKRRLETTEGHPSVLKYHGEPVDATRCQLQGFRTLFGSMHHFQPHLLEQMLADAARRGEGFAAFEATKRSALGLALAFFLLFPLGYLLPLLMIRRMSLLQILTTFFVPVTPFVLWIDGIVSCLRTYTRSEFLEIARRADPEGKFDWDVTDSYPDGIGLHPVTCYLGIPKKTNFN